MSFTLGVTTDDSVSRTIYSTNSHSDAGCRIGAWLDVTNAPITVSKIGWWYQENDVPAVYKAVIVQAGAYDSVNVAYPVVAALGYTAEQSMAGNHATDGLHEVDIAGGPIVIASNMTIGLGLVGWQNGTGSNYPFMALHCSALSTIPSHKFYNGVGLEYNTLGAHSLDVASNVANTGDQGVASMYIVYDLGSGGANVPPLGYKQSRDVRRRR